MWHVCVSTLADRTRVYERAAVAALGNKYRAFERCPTSHHSGEGARAREFRNGSSEGQDIVARSGRGP